MDFSEYMSKLIQKNQGRARERAPPATGGRWDTNTTGPPPPARARPRTRQHKYTRQITSRNTRMKHRYASRSPPCWKTHLSVARPALPLIKQISVSPLSDALYSRSSSPPSPSSPSSSLCVLRHLPHLQDIVLRHTRHHPLVIGVEAKVGHLGDVPAVDEGAGGRPRRPRRSAPRQSSTDPTFSRRSEADARIVSLNGDQHTW